MRALILSAVASLVSTLVIVGLGTNIGWDDTAIWVLLISWLIIFIPQLIVRMMTYRERLNTEARIVDKAVRISSDELQVEVKRIDREIEKGNKRSVALGGMCDKEFQQIKEEIVRMGGNMLPVLLGGILEGGEGRLTGDLRVQVTEPKSKWSKIKKTMGKCWNWLGRHVG